MDWLGRFAWPAYLAVGGLEDACRSLLEDEMLARAEAELEKLWHELPSGPTAERFEAVMKYDSRISQWQNKLAQHFTG